MNDLALPTHYERRYWIAAMIVHRFRIIRADEGTQAAARRLKKYGFPLPVALRVLGITPTHRMPVCVQIVER